MLLDTLLLVLQTVVFFFQSFIEDYLLKSDLVGVFVLLHLHVQLVLFLFLLFYQLRLPLKPTTRRELFRFIDLGGCSLLLYSRCCFLVSLSPCLLLQIGMAYSLSINYQERLLWPFRSVFCQYTVER